MSYLTHSLVTWPGQFGILGKMPWGTHCGHFFQTGKDLVETLVPYFKVGLETRELCLWIAHAPLTEQQARRALKQGVPDADRYLADRSMEIVSSQDWYLNGGKFSPERALLRLNDKLAEASAKGYAGVRANGNVAWLERKDWSRFVEYERALDESLAGKPVIVMCSYSLLRCGATDVLDVARTHQFAVAKGVDNRDAVEWTTPFTADLYGTLTSREREVLLHAADGLSNPQIAERLSIGVRTVETHRANLMRKLGLRNQTNLVRYALQRGLLPLDGGRQYPKIVRQSSTDRRLALAQ